MMKPLKKIIAFTAVPFFLLLMITLNLNACSAKPDSSTNPGTGFAVLELFTSEGCSSCPPAEQLLERIQSESSGKPVYVLAYHVDYWDRLGWKDAFSSPAFSVRQQEYSRYFAGQVYTPQLIVNGISEGVGSDKSFVENTMAKMLAQPAISTLTISAHQQSGKAQIDYVIGGDSRDTRLEIALVQKHAISNVLRGENKGRTLPHVQIVRSLSVFDIAGKKSGTEHIILPEDVNTEDWEIIGLLHHTGTGQITAANRTAIVL